VGFRGGSLKKEEGKVYKWQPTKTELSGNVASNFYLKISTAESTAVKLLHLTSGFALAAEYTNS